MLSCEEDAVEGTASGTHRSGRLTATPMAALAVAIIVTVITFPDVVLGGASVRNSRILGVFEPATPASAWLPETADRSVTDGFRDLGAAAWQLEPAQRFMHRCLVDGESPFWNPYNACGTLGPERLTSAQFSAFTILSAILGANTTTWHGIWLAAIVISVFALYLSLTRYFGRSAPAAVLACFVYLLTGFHTSMLGSQMSQPYLLAPVLLLALLALDNAASPTRLVFGASASALFMAETFVPTMALLLFSVHLVTFARAAEFLRDRGRLQWPRAWRLFGRHAVVTVLGAALLAPLWVPAIDAYQHTDLGDYRSRRIETAAGSTALSVVTPKHFWESYGAYWRTGATRQESLNLSEIDATRVYHLGLVALIVAAHALAGSTTRRSPVVWAALLLMAIGLGRVFGVAPFSVVAHLPVLGLFSIQYWGAPVCFVFPMLVAYGLDALDSRTAGSWSTMAVLGAVGVCCFFLLGRLGEPLAAIVWFHLTVIALLFAASLAAILTLWARPRTRPAVVAVLTTLAVGELMFDLNRLRPERRETDFSTVALVRYLQSQGGDGRVLNIGGRGLYPNWGSALAIPQVDSLDGLSLGWYDAFFDQRFGKTHNFLAIRYWRKDDPPDKVATFDLAALNLLGVRHIVVASEMANFLRRLTAHGLPIEFQDKHLVVLSNPNALPRAFAATWVVDGPGLPSDRGLPLRTVVTTTDTDLLRLAGDLGIPRANGSRPPYLEDNRTSVVITAAHHTRVELQASLPAPAVVVLADTWHPGWKATTDGEPAEVWRVDEVLRGVALPEGEHRIVFTYSPRTLPAALLIWGATICILAGWWLYRRRKDAGH